jgi:hypothetical protein
MPLYFCRWQNGNFSAINAVSREHAIVLLDEIGNAETCELFPVEDFMVHFRLKDKADNIEGTSPLELEGFGGETLNVLYERLYPVYAKALVDAVETWRTDEPMQSEKVEEVLRELNTALAVERTRQWGTIVDVLGNTEAVHLQDVGDDIPKSFAAAATAQAESYPQSGPKHSVPLPFSQATDSEGQISPDNSASPSKQAAPDENPRPESNQLDKETALNTSEAEGN